MVLSAGCSSSLGPERTLADIRLKTRRGELDSALRDVEKAYHEYAKKDPAWAWQFRVQNAHVLVLRGSYGDALHLLEDSVPAPLNHSEVAVRRKIVQGIAHDYIQAFAQAVADLDEAEQLARSFQPSLLGDVYQARGSLDIHKKDFSAAAAAFRMALNISRREHLSFLEANALGSMGYLAMWQEHYDEAIDWFKLALEKSEQVGTQFTLAKTFGNLGWNYAVVGDFEGAEAMLTQAEEASVKAGLIGDQVKWLNTLSDVYYQQRRYDIARATSGQALDLARKVGDQGDVTKCLNSASDIALATGRVDSAEKYNREALEIERAGLDQFGIASSMIIAGRVAASNKQYREAKETFQKVIRDKGLETALRWEAHTRLAQVYAAENLSASAETEFRYAIATIETARSGVHRDEFRVSFLSTAIEFYDDYVDFLIAQGRPDDALKVAELSRARTLEEGLASTAQAASLTRKRVRPQETAQKWKATLLFYWIGHNHSYLWVITPAKTEHFELPKAADIEPAVKAYRKTVLGMRDAQDPGGSDGKKLYAMLVEPAKKQIPRGSRVIVLPAESLYGLNFETLIVPDPQPHFWIEDVTLTTASSLTLLEHAATRPTTQERNLLLVGNTEQPNADFPTLSQAPAEIQKIEHYFPDSNRKVLEGKQATPSAYLSSSPERFSYLHFVTHGTASHARPLESAVILSKEGDSYKLYARDIVQHRLNANLVTISACNGSGTRAYSGEGLVGLSWAFLRAGAHNVIAALWEVSDASTPQLMDALYGELSQGKDPATALRDAKLSLLHSSDPSSVFKKPFYWAPFQLYAGS